LYITNIHYYILFGTKLVNKIHTNVTILVKNTKNTKKCKIAPTFMLDFQVFILPLHSVIASRVAKCPPTGLLRIVGSGGKRMRVSYINPLKINDYGNQED